MTSARYRRWDGTQDPLGEDVDIGDVLQQLGDDLLAGAGGRQALQRLLRRGVGDRAGLDELRERVRRQREALRAELDEQSPLQWVQDELDEIESLERAAIDESDDDGLLARLSLDHMPPDPAGRMRAFTGHAFQSDEARNLFEELQDRLRRELLDTTVRGLSDAMSSVTPEDLAAVTAMLADLNELLAARDRGEDTTDGFREFMQRHGELFPEHPADLDELLAVLARRAMAMQGLLRSMSPAQRAQLQDLARQVLDDPDLAAQLQQLRGHLAQALPSLDLHGDVPQRDDAGPLGGLVDGWEQLADLSALEDALAGQYAGAQLEDVDEDALRRALGQDAVRDLERLRAIERELERAGVVRQRDGELELTPRGARLLGERSLASILAHIRREPDTRRGGADPEPTGQTRPWRFGDTEPIATSRTIRNAVVRQSADGTLSAGVRLSPDDLEVVEQEVRPRTATALLLDLSFSMPLQGHFVPAKRMALALHALIEGRHRQDSLHLIGFSDYARRLQPADLAAAGFERVYGTNMQHAFLLARRALADDPRPVKQVIMVTDGEPTAHLEGGESIFNWPPVRETLEATLREGMRLARSGATLHMFLLEDAPGLVAFAERLAGLTGGSVVQMSAERAGETILSDYGLG